MEDKERGGQNAALALEEGLVKSLSLQSNDELIVVLALNSAGLASVLAQSKKGMVKFWKGLNSALSVRRKPTSFTAVDAGRKGQAADKCLKRSCFCAAVCRLRLTSMLSDIYCSTPTEELKAFVMAGHHDKRCDALVKDTRSKTDTHVLLTYASMVRLRIAFCPMLVSVSALPAPATLIFMPV